jgi:two-component system sensor histidine kinase RegB
MQENIQVGNLRNHLRQLFLIRNVAISGILVAIFIAHFLLEIALPLIPLLLVMCFLILFNLFTWFRAWKGLSAVTQQEFFIHLLIDILYFSVLLYLTGGASNPFSLVFLIPIIISAIVLAAPFTWALALIAISCYGYLVWGYNPEHDMHSMHGEAGVFSLHIVGMWIGFIFGTFLVAYFVTRMGSMLREQQRELHAIREQALRDEQLVAIGTLAAGTAHEMGTPLGTMSLIAEELLDEAKTEDTKKQVQVLIDQVQRCKKALANLSACAGNQAAESGHMLSVDAMFRQLIDEWQARWPDSNLHASIEGQGEAPEILMDRSLEHAIINVLDNAAAVSEQSIEFKGTWNAHLICIDVYDRGPGLDGSMQEWLGKQPVQSETGGLGLGLFLAHSVIRRFGGQVSLYNRDGGGVQTHIEIPVGAIG